MSDVTFDFFISYILHAARCRYAVTVASAFLELLIQERSVIMDKSRKVVKRDLAAAITALKQIPSKVPQITHIQNHILSSR